jgi:hypothetical protein
MILLWQKHAMVNVVNHALRLGRSIGVAGGQGWQPLHHRRPIGRARDVIFKRA